MVRRYVIGIHFKVIADYLAIKATKPKMILYWI